MKLTPIICSLLCVIVCFCANAQTKPMAADTTKPAKVWIRNHTGQIIADQDAKVPRSFFESQKLSVHNSAGWKSGDKVIVSLPGVAHQVESPYIPANVRNDIVKSPAGTPVRITVVHNGVYTTLSIFIEDEKEKTLHRE